MEDYDLDELNSNDSYELYDIITLKNDEKYTITAKLNKSGNTYLMLVGVDKDENPIPYKTKAVEYNQEKSTIKEIKDSDESLSILKELINQTEKNLTEN